MRDEGRVRRIREPFNPVLTAEAELLLLQAGLLDPDFEDDPLPGEAWLRRMEYDGPPQFSPEERIERIFDPVRIANHYRSCVAASAGPWRVTMAKANLDQMAEQLAALTAIVGNMVKAQFSAPTTAPVEPPKAAAPAIPPPATATKAKRTTRKTSSPAPSVKQSGTVKDGVITILLTKVKATQNSLVIRETVNGVPLNVEATGYAGGFVGDMHVRRELLDAFGVAKGNGKKLDGPDLFEITIRPVSR